MQKSQESRNQPAKSGANLKQGGLGPASALTSASAEVHLPQTVLEVMARGQGLVVISGTRSDQVATSLHLILRELGENSSGRISILGSLPFADFPYSGDLEFHEDESIRESLSKSSILPFFSNLKELDLAIQLSEEGRLVILPAYALSAIGVLHKLFSYIPQAAVEHWLFRFAECLEVVSHQTAFFGPQGELSLANELILLTPEIREHLRQGNLAAIADDLQNDTEKMGMVSRNQALVQLLVRRKIDFKTAFAKSMDPEGLDAMLKKLGF